MIEDEVRRMTNEVFEESFEIQRDQLKPEAHVFEDLGLDSLDTVDLVVALQKKFGVSMRDDARIREVRTLGDIYGLILTIQDDVQAGQRG